MDTVNEWVAVRTHFRSLIVSTDNAQADRPGAGKDSLIFPFSTYFAAFEIPNRLYIIGKDPRNPVVQLKSPVESVSAGVSFERDSPDSTSHGLILVQQVSGPRLMSLPLLSQVHSSTPAKLANLQLGFNNGTHGSAFVRDETAAYIVISHPKGLIERRKVLL